MDACDYADGESITINSIFNACVDSFNYTNTDIAQPEILDMIRRIGEKCEPETHYHPGDELAVVDYVIDGDTLSIFSCPDNVCSLASLEATRIRLWHTSVNEIDYPSGEEAKSWVQERIGEGDTISFDRKGEDPYGRILAIVYSDAGENINTGLIESGYGRPWTAEESELYETKIEDGENTEPPYGTVIQFVEVTSMPENIVLGSINWIGANYKNVGDKSGKYWLGVRLQDAEDTSWRFTGDPTYASSIDPGETKTFWCKFSPPLTLVSPLRVFLIINKV